VQAALEMKSFCILKYMRAYPIQAVVEFFFGLISSK